MIEGEEWQKEGNERRNGMTEGEEWKFGRNFKNRLSIEWRNQKLWRKEGRKKGMKKGLRDMMQNRNASTSKSTISIHGWPNKAQTRWVELSWAEKVWFM